MLQPGLMMDRPLLISSILEHACAQFAEQEVVSRETHGPLFRHTFAQAGRRARQWARPRLPGLRPADAGRRSAPRRDAASCLPQQAFEAQPLL